MKEEWRQTAWDYIEISNLGNVRTRDIGRCFLFYDRHNKLFRPTTRLTKSHIMSIQENNKGYLFVCAKENGRRKNLLIHRLVAEAFILNPNNFPEVNHIDGNKANNCVDNLEWVSKSQNKWHACNVLGQRTNRIKDFSTGNVFPSQKSAALYYGVSESLIKAIVKKQIFSKRKKKQEITNHRIEIISEREYVDSLNKSKLVDAVNELQMKLEPHKCEPAENTTISKMENVAENSQSAKIAQGFKNLQDPYAEQRKWIGKLCWFWNNDNEPDTCFGVLTGIFDEADRPFERSIGQQLYRYCEPVKPDDDIIYKGGNNE